MESPNNRESNPIRISVAMCCFNGGSCLDDQLASILRQSRSPDELVVCDDGSSDSTVARLQEYARNSPFPVRVVLNQKNLGVTRNFEKAISLCSGNVIALSDQDDVWHASRLQRTEQVFLKQPDAGLVFSNADVIDLHSRRTTARLWDRARFSRRQRSQFRDGQATQALVRHNVVTGATMAFRASFRSLVLPVPKDWVHDAWIALAISFFSNIVALNESLIFYREHATQHIGLPGTALEKMARSGQAQRADLEGHVRLFTTARDWLAPRADNESRRQALLAIDQKIRHLQTRARRPQNRLLRVPVVAREVVSSRYGRYSQGLKSAVWDLIVRSLTI